MVSQTFRFDKTYQSAYFTSVWFIVCQLYLHKYVFSKSIAEGQSGGKPADALPEGRAYTSRPRSQEELETRRDRSLQADNCEPTS